MCARKVFLDFVRLPIQNIIISNLANLQIKEFMMSEMTTRERFLRMFEHREADRVPIIDSPWNATIERWCGEGMPKDIHFTEFFEIDRVVDIIPGKPPYQEDEILEETEHYRIYKNSWETKFKQWKHWASTPEYLEFGVFDRESWDKAKSRLTPRRDHIDWSFLKRNYPNWRKNGWWIQAQLWFGFDITHSWIVGTEKMLLALIEDPEWCMDIFATELEYNLALCQMIWDAGYQFDAIFWPDDMGFKHSQFFSMEMYRSILKPFHQKAIDWAHQKKIKAHLHSCGDIRPFIPELIDMGLDALNPLEVKAGMNPVELKAKYGNQLTLHGGINAVLYDQPEKIKTEIEQLVPVMMNNGGYIFSSDHSVPSSVSLEDFRQITQLAKRVGTYSA